MKTTQPFNGRPVVIIKIHRSVIAQKGGVYEAVRSCWRVNLKQVDGRAVIAVEIESNDIVGVYDVFPGAWIQCPTVPERKEFTASPVPPDWGVPFVGTQLPREYRTGRNPIRYVN